MVPAVGRAKSSAVPPFISELKVIASLELPLPPENPIAPASESNPRTSRLDIARLILALIMTPAVLIYAWGRVLVFGMFRARPETLYVGALIFGIVAVILLTAGL